MSQVHFCNRTGECSLIRDVYEVNGMRLVDVPNILLQDNWDIKVYGWDASHTKRSTTYNVVARTRPENYVYTETEQLKWEMLEERIDEIEEKGVSDEKLNSAVNAYLEANPIEIPVESVNGKTGAVVLTAADVGALSADTEIPSTAGLATETFVEEYVDEQNFADKTYVKNYVTQEIEDALADFEPSTGGSGSDVDLSNYYTIKEVDALIEEIELTPGPQGEAGYTPVKGVDYFDGEDGKDGAAGLDGADGYTPVKGVDYWTEADKAEMVSDVLAALPAAEEVSV